MEEGLMTDECSVAKLWGNVAVQREACPYLGWLDSPIVLEEYVQAKQTGFREKNWLVGLIEELKIAPTARWLSLGCGSAGTEIFVASLGLVKGPMLCTDLSQDALDVAARAAEEHQIENCQFRLFDFNTERLESNSYDVVLMNMSLHHVERLEDLLSEVASAMCPSGILLLNEFVGPSRFQFTDLQLSLTRQALSKLPETWRIDIHTSEPKTEYIRQPISYWLSTDPSEAVRSSEIVGALQRNFEIILRRDYGGTVLGLALEHIIHNFRAEDVGQVTAIRLLGLMEDNLIRGGVLPSDYAIFALRKRQLPRRRRFPVLWSL
jgi:ubiquinone/menaquinone biosynthesis C-methylase UbiE